MDRIVNLTFKRELVDGWVELFGERLGEPYGVDQIVDRMVDRM